MSRYIDQWSHDEFENHIEKTLRLNVTVNNVEIAGDGNMNFTYRIYTEKNATLIIKQSPPYCARFPDISAPEERILAEFNFYKLAAKNEFLLSHSPVLLGLDEEKKIAYMSDLGATTDFEYLYTQNELLTSQTCKKLIAYLRTLHELKIDDDVSFENMGMRDLNHDYIFKLPFILGDTAINLDDVTPGLQDIANIYKDDLELKAAALDLGQLYYQKSRTLIHGDYYPMSWINTDQGLFIIDPEFGFLGLAEIDLGVFLAHMLLSNNYSVALSTIKKDYGPCDMELVAKFCAVEVIRRITYVSQLPIINSLPFKSSLLAKSALVLKSGRIDHYE
ncbi:MAG: phosphotransferase [Emcibacteraceae bacterium]|nr:phosphotransferase [Emcibacteraceae bacterium]